MIVPIKEERGSIQIICLITCAIVGIALASYLKLVRIQNISVARSQLWNMAIPVCEAGVEEALSQINSVIGTNYAINGWVANVDHFEKDGTIGEHRYHVEISTNLFPNVTTSAYIKSYLPGASSPFAALVVPDQPVELQRKVYVTTTRWSTGMKGIIAKYDITMTGNSYVDSFDSEDARYSTRGRYDPNKRKDNGFAGSVFGNVEDAIIYGTVGTGPEGSVTGTVGDFNWVANNSGLQPGHYANDMNLAFPEVQAPFDGGAFAPGSGTLTLTNFLYWSTFITTNVPPATPPASPVTTNLLGIVTTTTYPTGVDANLITTNTTPQRTKTAPAPGTYLNLVIKGAWYYYDLITSYTYPSLTYSYSTTATSNDVTTDFYTYILSDSRYQMDGLSLSGNQKLIVTGTNVTLYIKGDFTMTGNSQLIITPDASLKIYVSGKTSLSGNGIFNYTLDASHFMYYGLSSNTEIKITGNASFTGCIYAPRADMQLGGGGNDVYDVVGATITKTAFLNGHFHFHYDEKLGRSKIQSNFTVASWTEI